MGLRQSRARTWRRRLKQAVTVTVRRVLGGNLRQASSASHTLSTRNRPLVRKQHTIGLSPSYRRSWTGAGLSPEKQQQIQSASIQLPQRARPERSRRANSTRCAMSDTAGPGRGKGTTAAAVRLRRNLRREHSHMSSQETTTTLCQGKTGRWDRLAGSPALGLAAPNPPIQRRCGPSQTLEANVLRGKIQAILTGHTMCH
mmetsp:Transcript_25174/g.65695  ORF Transcript_25174/g.65695 Transcript_25174/m.65695 type:complete len:200 (+) Transcript_25174:1746-2345(+)